MPRTLLCWVVRAYNTCDFLISTWCFQRRIQPCGSWLLFSSSHDWKSAFVSSHKHYRMPPSSAETLADIHASSSAIYALGQAVPFSYWKILFTTKLKRRIELNAVVRSGDYYANTASQWMCLPTLCNGLKNSLTCHHMLYPKTAGITRKVDAARIFR